MRSPISRSLVVSAAVLAALWLVVVGVRAALSQVQSGIAQLAGLLPAVVPTQLTWPENGAWAVLAPLVGAVALALGYLAVATRAGARGVVVPWFAAALAAAAVGLVIDVGSTWAFLADYGVRGLLGTGFGAAAASGAFFGLAVGWVPGLIARRESATEPRRRPAWLVPAAAIGVVAVLASTMAADAARTASIAAEAEAQREVQAQSSFGALPDPDAPGEPVPETAGVALEVEPDECTPDTATVLKGEPDAATGHRGLPLELFNFSDQPCVVEGYPDVAFGDQNAHLLAVTVVEGGSFMAQDQGPQRIEIPPGGTAVSVIGWDAASPHGALVTHTVWAAQTAGMPRGSWPLELDIVEGSSVAVTAWSLVDPRSAG